MERNIKSHGRKSDKETHTPMLKIFKDIMQLEKNDPEKANLLNESERHKKKKQYKTSRSKSDHTVNRPCDSASSDRNCVTSKLPEIRQYDVHTCQCKGGKKSEDTASCTSCALKRLATSDYACIACLGVVFVITVIVAFYIVFKSPCDTRLKTDRPGRRIFRGINLGDVGLKADEDRNDWDDSKLGGDGVMSGLPSTDFDDTGAKGFNLGGDNQFSELSRIIDMNKLNYDKSSQRLKNFYTKLLRTDDQIKNLRKGLGDSTMMKYTDKIKRSLNHRDINLNEVNNDVKHKKRNGKTKRTKRHDNYTLPASYVIENEKIMIHYPDNVRKKVPKCSHTPKESKSHSHETDLKHPFYKHTQRLDELLDKFIDKNLPQLLSDPFGIDMFQSDVETTTNRVDSAGNRKVTDAKNVAVINDPIISSPSDFFKITSRGSSDPDVILGVTTVMSSSKHVKSLIDRVPNIRKLMQAYEESDDNLGYDDLEEVLTDDVDNHDDPEVKIDRNKRSNPDRESHPVFEGGKSKPVGVPIPNWKGPLPLYPDEMNTMIKQEQSHKPTNTKEENSLMNRPISNDIEYIEDYLSSKYEKLANMAQAYSDYGVLDEKKEAKNANQNPEKLNVEHRVKLSVDNPTMLITTTTVASNINKLSKYLENHVKYIKESHSPKKFMATMKDNDYNIINSLVNLTRPSETGRRIFHFLNDEDKKIKRVERSVTSVDNGTISDKISNNVTVKKRSLKEFFTKPEDVVTIKVGTDKDYSNDNNTFLTIDYSLGRDVTEIKFKADGQTTKRTSDDNLDLAGNVSFKRRSLKSIDMDKTDYDTVIGIDGKLIPDETTSDSTLHDDMRMSNNFLNENPLKTTDIKNDEAIGIGVAHTKTTLNISSNITNEIFATKAPLFTDESKFVNDNVDSSNGNISSNIKTKENNDSEIDLKLDTDTKNRVSNMLNLVNARNTSETDNGMDLSDFFRMISTWFSSLASTSLDNFDDQAGNNTSIMKLKSNENGAIGLNNTSAIFYPNYDSDMIENIGHRSRVLMSVGESNNTSEDNNNNVAVHDGNDNEKNDADQIAMSNSTDPPANLMTTSKDANVKSSKDVESHENKTVVKRSLSDSGLVFWSDIYDDEYGVKVDPLEKEVDERSREGRGFMKRSKYWLQDKIRSIADNIKDFRYVGGKKDADTYNSYPKVFKRHAKLDKVDVDDTNKVTNFAELKVKMRSVCKEAAKAVQQTRKMQVRESQSDSAANTIMMQLVRMMTDLVDFQVKQKTCIKLPPDLQNFLEWLTTPSQGQTSRQSSVDKDFLDETNVLGKVKDLDSPRPNDEKAEYLESIRAVEDLLHEYDLMNDEEKSKMSGVRQYLENQHDYLTRQAAIFDGINFSNMYSNQPSLRFRREIKPQTASYVKSNIKRRLKRRLRKLMRNFNKKHTRSTADDSRVTDSVRYNNDGNVINNKIDKFAKKDDGSNEFKINSEPMKNNHGVYEDRNADNNRDLFDNNDVFDKEFSNNNDKVDVNNDMMKRNLQDVYYRALSEAKKVTTVKPNGG